MSAAPDPLNEMRELADTMFDGAIDPQRLQRLDDLIINHPAGPQAYLELINLHGELFCQANFLSDEQAALGVLQEFTRACERQERRQLRRHRRLTMSVACASIVCVLGSWFLLTGVFQSAPLGSVAFLTNDAHMKSGHLELGDILRQGKTLSIGEGMVSVQLPNVLIDLVGPAELKFQSEKQVQLDQGALTARVLPGGEGFSVRTPDAEVVDLGTEFLVNYDAEAGTNVAVRRGRAQVSLLDSQGHSARMLELTSQRSAQVQRQKNLVKEIDFLPASFEQIDSTRGGIRRLDGAVRTSGRLTRTFRSGGTTTPNHLLILPERQNVTLTEDLVLGGEANPIRIPAGSLVSSYLIHYDPPAMATVAPRGAITFFDEIAAVITSNDDLHATDQVLGLPGAKYETSKFRQLELNEDEIRVSTESHTLSFYLSVSPPAYLDEARIVTVSDFHPLQPPAP